MDVANLTELHNFRVARFSIGRLWSTSATNTNTKTLTDACVELAIVQNAIVLEAVFGLEMEVERPMK